MSSDDRILEVQGLTKIYGRTPAVARIDFDIRKGEVFTLLGHSGCGKSTTLRLVAGLEVPDDGTITLRGRVVASVPRNIFLPAERRNLGMVFQSYAVWPHMTVAENVGYPLEVRRVRRSEVRRRVEEMCGIVGLEAMVDRPATQLSGGQQQRVALARALAYEPDILLLDEPFSNLDTKLREELRMQLKALHNRLGTTVLYVTHDQTEAMVLSDRVAVMQNGVIEQVGQPLEIYERPSSFFVQSFVGRTIVLAGEIVQRNGGAVTVRFRHAPDAHLTVSGEGPRQREVRIAIRPEDVHVDTGDGRPADGCIVGEVIDTNYGGDHYDCLVNAAGCEIALRLPKSMAVRPGASIPLRLDPEKVKLWPDSSR